MKRAQTILHFFFLTLAVAVLFFQGANALADTIDLKAEPREDGITLMQVDPFSKIEWLARAPDDHPGEWTQARVNGVIGWIETSNLALNRESLPVADLRTTNQPGDTPFDLFAVDLGGCSSGGRIRATGTQTTGGTTTTAGSSGSLNSNAFCGGVTVSNPLGQFINLAVFNPFNQLADLLIGARDASYTPSSWARIGVSDTSNSQSMSFQRDAGTGTLDSTVTYKRGTTFTATAGVQGNVADFDCGTNGTAGTCMVGVGAHAGVNIFEETVRTSFDQSCCGGGVTIQSSSRTTVQPLVGASVFVSVPTGNPAVPYFDVIGRAEWNRGPGDFNFSTNDGFGNPITDRVSQKSDVSFGVTVQVPLPSATAFSDKRLKRDIELLAPLTKGVNLYAYRYIGDTRRRVGVMAQEVIGLFPDAVLRDQSGFFMVDYGVVFSDRGMRDALEKSGYALNL